jgi:hypothetical protein
MERDTEMLYLALLLPALCMVEKMLGQEKPVALSLDSVIPYSLEIVQQIVVDVGSPLITGSLIIPNPRFFIGCVPSL